MSIKLKTKELWWHIKQKHVLIVFIVFILSLCAAVGLFGIPDIWKNVFVVIVSAAATYVIVALVSGVQQEQQNKQIEVQARFQNKQIEDQARFQSELLKKQSEVSEEKEKSVHLYQSKMDVLSAFTKELWSQAATGDFLELKKLRALLFDKVLFFLTKTDIDGLTTIFNKIEPNSKVNTINLYSEITVLIKHSLDDDRIKKNSDNAFFSKEELKELWLAISKHIQPEEAKTSINPNQDINGDAATTDSVDVVWENDSTPKYKLEFNQAWHFAMWGNEQITALEKGTNELSLVEYGESWRTNLIKQVRENDVVFLFRRGGYGYVGAFKPLGWRIFDYDEQKETLHFFGQQEQVKPVNDDDVMNYDIYNGRDDGADLCSNLIVEPIAYVPDGVGNPGGVYRRTISRYDAGYAATLLELFKK